MRIFAAAMQTETNTFAPWPTGVRAFSQERTTCGDSVLEGTGPEHSTARLWSELSQRDDHDLFLSLFAYAIPSGTTVQSVYEGLRDEILADFADNGPFDIALLFLHGAMVATDCDDCEADLVSRMRALAGSAAVIGVELDLHCHLTRELVDVADAVILMKEFPHDDYLDRARELYDLCVAAKLGRVLPTSFLFDCRMVGFYPTTQQPMAELVQQLRDAERTPGVLSVSFAHGFPWGDVPENGSRVLVITDGDEGLAAQCAERIGLEIYSRRNALLPRYPSMWQALDEALHTPGLVVLADVADNAGGGAPSDNVSFLRLMLSRGIHSAAVGAIWDPIVASACADAGVGATLNIRLGGKMGKASGEPLDAQVIVRACCEQHYQAGLGNAVAQLGLSVWIEIDGIHVVVCSTRVQIFDPRAFTGLGVPLETLKLVAVKSSQHFYNRFAPIAAKVIWVATPGLLDMNFAGLSYLRKCDMEFFPRVEAPLG
jgi:microcystin degradation protein MlrC